MSIILPSVGMNIRVVIDGSYAAGLICWVPSDLDTPLYVGVWVFPPLGANPYPINEIEFKQPGATPAGKAWVELADPWIHNSFAGAN
jgi:hypothetical protein